MRDFLRFFVENTPDGRSLLLGGLPALADRGQKGEQTLVGEKRLREIAAFLGRQVGPIKTFPRCTRRGSIYFPESTA
jgi:hypothetical protein